MIATPKYSDTTHQMNYQYSYGCDGIGNKATTAGEIRGELVFECLTGPLDVGGAMTARETREAWRGMGGVVAGEALLAGLLFIMANHYAKAES